jgi:hypothetical protein
MMHSFPFRKFCQLFTVALLTVFSVSACAFSLPNFAGATVVPPPKVTQEVTRLVPQDVTQEVTRLFMVPVTVTPTETPVYTNTPSYTPTITSTPTITPIPEPPVITILEYSDCLYGPAAFFLYKTSLPVNHPMEVVGRNPDGTWIYVEEIHGWDPCWIPIAQTSISNDSVEAVPVVYPSLPHSYWYKPPNPVAHRDGNEVTVSWKAVRIAEYDYRGYLIIAWVCQGGARVFLPVSFVPPYAENTGTLSVKITDEPGCSGVSSAYIYTAEKRGYFGEMIFWPAY